MSKDSVLLTQLYPIVEKGLSNKENTAALKHAVGNYVDRNSEKLMTIGPLYQTIFRDSDAKELYDACGLDPNQIKSTIKQAGTFESHWKNATIPFNTASTLAIRYYTVKNNDEMVNAVLMYLGLSMYPSLFKKYFKFEPNEQTMNYTINNLSNKFKIKQLGTLSATIIDTVQGSYRLYKEDIIKGTDKGFVNFIMGVKTRLNSVMRNISNEFYDNHKQNLYLNVDSDNYDEDNYHEADSNTYAIERLTNNVTLNLTVNGPNMKLVASSAKWASVSVSELRNYTTSMVNSDHREEIRSVVESILFLFLFNDQNNVQEVGSTRFLVYCLDMYKKSNTTDENIIKIKAVLDKWLEDLGTYKKTQRLATINNFRRALFMFFVMSIMTTANGNA